MKFLLSIKKINKNVLCNNKDGEDCRMECEAESKPHGTANLFRRIPPGVVKSVGKK